MSDGRISDEETAMVVDAMVDRRIPEQRMIALVFREAPELTVNHRAFDGIARKSIVMNKQHNLFKCRTLDEREVFRDHYSNTLVILDWNENNDRVKQLLLFNHSL